MSTPHEKPLILLVDDIEDLLFAFSYHLSTFEGMRVVTASNGREGLERYFDVQPDCVIIDVKMPELDGYQLTRALRGDPESANTPLIILTAMTQDQDRFEGLASGIDRFLTKPIKPSELAVVIRECLKITESERQSQQIQLANDMSKE
jgi:DNA-binding response OmpR family regulator